MSNTGATVVEDFSVAVIANQIADWIAALCLDSQKTITT